jgi:hypothetical protein
MRKILTILICILAITPAYSQGVNTFQHTEDINRKLKALSTTTPDKPGGYIIDDSYEGVKGETCLFEKFLPLLVKVRESDYYLPVEANLDLVRNYFLYKEPVTNQIMSIPSERIVEVVIKSDKENLVFKTTKDLVLKPEIKEIKFIQVLKKEPVEIFKIPFKILIPSDYKGAYTAKRRYDEYKTTTRYYVLSHDNTYNQIRLTIKTLIRLFPDKKDTIIKAFRDKSDSDDEARFLSVLEKL